MKAQKLKKASLGAIVKSVASGVKAGKKTYKAVKSIEKAKKLAKAPKYGESGQYARLEDMKRSEWYRDRHNSGKEMPDSRDAVAKTKLKAMGLGLGVLGTSMLVDAAMGSKKKKPAAKKTTTAKKK